MIYIYLRGQFVPFSVGWAPDYIFHVILVNICVANVLFLYIYIFRGVFVGMYLQHFVLVQTDTLTF